MKRNLEQTDLQGVTEGMSLFLNLDRRLLKLLFDPACNVLEHHIQTSGI